MLFIQEVKLDKYDGTFHDYAEAVVQFGYVNLFSVVSDAHSIYLFTFDLFTHSFTFLLLTTGATLSRHSSVIGKSVKSKSKQSLVPKYSSRGYLVIRKSWKFPLQESDTISKMMRIIRTPSQFNLLNLYRFTSVTES